VTRYKKRKIPSNPRTTRHSRGVLELERFSEESLTKWLTRAKARDRLEDLLYFNVESERRRLRPEILQALAIIPPIELKLDRWVRIVDYKYCDNPLSSIGSLQFLGGRFNAGRDLDPNTMKPWPALYVAADFETAYREKFQLTKGSITNGLTPEELSLTHKKSMTAVYLNGYFSKVFDLTSVSNLEPVAKVFKRIEKPPQYEMIAKEKNIPYNPNIMARTAKQVHDFALEKNWSIRPQQFGLPASSQILAELIMAAGFEAVKYPSTKGGENCVVIFPECLSCDSYIELADDPPSNIKFT
jgi:hypothetical protein